MSSITPVLGGGVGSGAVLAATTTLPNTGGNTIVTLAVAIAAGLLTWGALYSYVNR
jgi:LPXTG-motif cell wall-anchored protein